MIKIILFDCDGVIIKKHKRFSQLLQEDFGITKEQTAGFFKGVFLDCETGKADLKQELPVVLKTWGWQKSQEEFLKIWFESEKEIDEQMANYILSLRLHNIKTYLSTNNEKYRVFYLLNIAGLKDLLSGTMASYELGYLKPEMEFWQAAHKRLGSIEKNEVLVWDDAQSAVDSARAYGFNAEFYSDFESFKNLMREKYAL